MFKFLAVSDTIGGEYIQLSRISKKMGTKLKVLFQNGQISNDLEFTITGKVTNYLFLKLLEKNYVSKEMYMSILSRISAMSIKFDFGNEYIISTAFLWPPRKGSRNIIVMTPDRVFTVEYDRNRKKFEQSVLLLIGFELFGVLEKLYMTHVLRRAKHVISISQIVAMRLKDSYGINSAVVYPSIDPDEFHCEGYNKYFLYVSRLTPSKRQDYAIRAFSIFSSQRSDFQLIIACNSPDTLENTGYLESMYRFINDNLNVRFLFDQDKDSISKLYANSYACLFSAVNEDFGLIPLEAMASEKPIISVNEGGPKETIINNITGFLVNSEEEMAQKMLELSNNPDLVTSMGKQGRKHVAENFSDDKFISSLTKVLQN